MLSTWSHCHYGTIARGGKLNALLAICNRWIPLTNGQQWDALSVIFAVSSNKLVIGDAVTLIWRHYIAFRG